MHKGRNYYLKLYGSDPVYLGLVDAARVLRREMKVSHWLLLRDVSLRGTSKGHVVFTSDDKSMRRYYAIAARSASRRMGVHISSLETAVTSIPSSDVELSAKTRILQRFDQLLCCTNAGTPDKVHTFDSLGAVRKFFLNTWKPGMGIGYKYDESTQRLTDAQKEWACSTWKKLTPDERIALRKAYEFPSDLGSIRGGGAAAAERYFKGMCINFTVAHYKYLKNFVYGYADENKNNNNKEEINK